MTGVWPYLSLLATIGVLLLILAFTLVLFLATIEQALERRSKYLFAAIFSTFSVVLAMALFAAVTVLAADQSEGRLHTGIAATVIGLIMLASGVQGSIQATQDTMWTPTFRFAQVLLGLAVYIVIAISQPEWLMPLADPLLRIVQWLFEVPILGWIARISGGLFVIWSIGALFRFVVVAVAAPASLAAHREKR
jgi:hypothetical protein